MGALRLRPMSDDELAEFLPRGEDGYYRQLVVAGMDEGEAREKAGRDYASVFPDRRVQEGHFVFVVEDDAGHTVGHVVYAVRPPGSRRAWLYKLEIDEEERGRGYGREAMHLFEEDAARRGLTEVGLNVFGGNEAARSLYRSLGYSEFAVDMTKRLDVHETA
jgi:RimJ/RimL family protein N-acetyltransferase